MRPEITQVGDLFLFTWKDAGLRVQFDRIRETDSSQLRCEVTVETLEGEHSYWAPFSLATNTDRDRLVKALRKVAADVDWEPQVSRACLELATRYRSIPEPIDLRTVIVPEHEEYTIQKMLPKGQISVFFGDQSSTKSYLGLLMALCIQLGIDLPFGPKVIRQGPVIYYDWETDQENQRRRFDRVCAGLGLKEQPLFLYMPMAERGRLVDCVREMRVQIAKIKPVAVFIDSLTYSAGGDLNETSVGGGTMSAIGMLGQGVDKIVLAHFGKSDRQVTSDRGRASVIGSSLFEFKARALWEMRRSDLPVKVGNRVTYTVSMMNHKASDDEHGGQFTYDIAFDNARRTTTFSVGDVADSLELINKLPPKKRVQKLLERELHTIEQLHELTEIPKGTLKRWLTQEMPEAVNHNRSAGGAGHAGVWGLRGVEYGPDGRSKNRSFPIDKNNLNGSGARSTRAPSDNRSGEPFTKGSDERLREYTEEDFAYEALPF